MVEKSQKVPDIKDRTYLIGPEKSQIVTVQIANPNDKVKLFLALANNFTKFETYQVDLEIKKSQLYVRHDEISPVFNEISDLDVWNENKGANILSVDLFSEDYFPRESFLYGQRTFELVNDGEGPIMIDHIGIDER